MREAGSNRVLNNIVSPYGLAALSYAFFLFSCLLPPSIYSHYMHERDLMFLDSTTILFYTLCVAAFIAGVGFVRWLFPFAPFVVRKFETRISPVFFLLVPLLSGIALTALSAFLLIKQNPDIILMLLSQRGGELKGIGAIDIEGTFATAPPMLIAIIFWAYWRSSELQLQGWRRWLVNFALFVAVLSAMSAAILILSRNLVMLAVSGLAILYVARSIARKEVTFKFLCRAGAAIATCIVLLFFAFSFLRGTETWDDQVYTLFGYTAASYNRLAAIVNGNMRYPFGGRGAYLSSFVTFSHFLNKIVPLASVMQWPGFQELWASEFGAVDLAGLDKGAIWAGAFGYIFSDLGWFSVPFVFGYGMLYGVVWNWFRRGKVTGIVLYPGIGFCALFWIGTNYLFDSEMVFLFASAIILAGYERVLVKESTAGATAGQLQ